MTGVFLISPKEKQGKWNSKGETTIKGILHLTSFQSSLLRAATPRRQQNQKAATILGYPISIYYNKIHLHKFCIHRP
jgi:hypothetical protein